MASSLAGAEDFETVHLHRDGSARNVAVSNRLVRSRGRTYIAAIWTDITQRKQAELALREAELRWKFALEGSGLGVWDWDITTKEVYFSPLWLAMIGYAEGELNPHFDTWAMLLHPDDHAAVFKALHAAFSKEVPVYVVDFRLRHKAGLVEMGAGARSGRGARGRRSAAAHDRRPCRHP
jgi:PAS domain-containing protein